MHHEGWEFATWSYETIGLTARWHSEGSSFNPGATRGPPNFHRQQLTPLSGSGVLSTAGLLWLVGLAQKHLQASCSGLAANSF